MKYQVVWNQDAEEDLAALWLVATDRRAVTRSTTMLEQSYRATRCT